MAKNNSTGMVRVKESEIRNYLDQQVREAVKQVLEEIMNAEAEELICAGPYERSEGRRDWRGGTRKRKLKTRVGEIELSVPRLRTLAFQTMIFERYRRLEISLEEALIEMYLLSLSTRKIGDVTEMLCDLPLSSSAQSRLNKKVYEKLEEWRMRPISPVVPYLCLDGIVMKVRVAGKYEKSSLLVATRVNPEGYREVLGAAPGFQEDKGSFLSFLRWLKEKGQKYVGLAPSLAHQGLREALSGCFPQADFKRCTVHFYRNILSCVPKRLREEVAAALKSKFTRRYEALLSHYGIKGAKTQAGKANENGDVEQSHHRLKRAVDQALMLRGSRDFPSRSAYDAFLGDLFAVRNAGRTERLAEELPCLGRLPQKRTEDFTRLRVGVGKSSTIRVKENTYSVPSRLVGSEVEVRVHADRLEVFYAQRLLETIPRLRGKGGHHIQYRHIIDWLMRKPGAFANYRYRADLFPSSRFRAAYDAL